MRNALERVRDRMRVVVHRIDAPRVAGPVMMRAPDPVDDWVAHVDVGRRHVDLRAEHTRAVWKFARAHAAEQVETLADRAVAMRAVAAGLLQRAAILTDLV